DVDPRGGLALADPEPRLAVAGEPTDPVVELHRELEPQRRECGGVEVLAAAVVPDLEADVVDHGTERNGRSGARPTSRGHGGDHTRPVTHASAHVRAGDRAPCRGVAAGRARVAAAPLAARPAHRELPAPLRPLRA